MQLLTRSAGRRTKARFATFASLASVIAGCSALTSFQGLAGEGANPTQNDAAAEGASFTDGASTIDSSTNTDSGTNIDAGPSIPTSCMGGGNGASATCGAMKNDDCCAILVVAGGTYFRSNEKGYPATVSSFYLDRFETTNGRFRKFVNGGFGTTASPPAAGSGAHPKITGSGWDSAWNSKLPSSTSDLVTRLHCGNSHWTDKADAYESYSASCLDWYTAFAFCAWDGGRLPTEAEWNYAAAGGSEQRNYPWTPPNQDPNVIDPSYATYGCYGHGGTPAYDEAGAPICSYDDIVPPGMHSPKGDGKWGHADLAGNMWEWTLDAYVSPYASTNCVDCANIGFMANANRVYRGGDYDTDKSSLVTAYRADDPATTYQDDIGIRCARDP